MSWGEDDDREGAHKKANIYDIFEIQGGRVVFNKIHLLQRSLLCFPPDHITRSQMSVDESVGESSYQFLLQVLFYLILVATNVRAADDPTVIIQLLLTFLFSCFSCLTKG